MRGVLAFLGLLFGLAGANAQQIELPANSVYGNALPVASNANSISFSQLQSYLTPYFNAAGGLAVAGITFSGTPAAGWVPMATDAAHAVWTAPVVTGGLVQNNSPANLAAWTRSLTAMLKTNSHPRVNVMGDSITLGAGVVLFKNTPTVQIANQLTTRGLQAYANVFGMPVATGAAVTTYDPRLVFTGTWAPWTQLAGGAGTFRCTSNAGTETFTPGYTHDTVDLYWLRGGVSGGGSMTITLLDGSNFNWSTFLASGGGSIASGGPVNTVTISQAGALAVMKTTITYASAGSRALVITNGVSGNIETYGIEAYTAGAGSILIREMGASGYNSGLLAGSGWTTGILQMPDELSILDIGRNDFAASISTTSYAANLAALNANMVANGGSVVYWTWPPSATSDTPLATQVTYINTMIAAAGTTIPVYNLWQRYTNMGGQVALAGFTGAGYYADTIHPAEFGNYDLAQWLVKALMREPQAGLD